MSDKKHIDRLFQERFKDFEMSPPPGTWEGIEKALNDEKKRDLIPFWWKWGGIAAAIAVLVTAIFMGLPALKNLNESSAIVNEEVQETDSPQTATEIDHDSSSTNRIVDHTKDSQNVQQVGQTSGLDDNYTGVQNEATLNQAVPSSLEPALQKRTAQPSKDHQSLRPVEALVQNSSTKKKSVEDLTIVGAEKQDPAINSLNGIAQGNNGEKNRAHSKILTQGLHSKVPAVDNPASIDTLSSMAESDLSKKMPSSLEDIAKKEASTDSLETNAFKSGWAVSTQMAPVFSNSLSGSGVNTQVRDNQTTTGVSISYGLGLAYHLSTRLTVRTGVNKINMSYTTQGIKYSPNNLAARGVSPDISSSFTPSSITNAGADITSAESFATGFAATEILSPTDFSGFEGELSQQLGYIEVPLEISYNLLDGAKPLQLNLLGGFSALFLTDNNVLVQNADRQLELGPDANFNDFNQSANIGLGLGYRFSKKLGAFLEPTFKYQLNTLKNNSAEFRPYSVGVQSGVIFNF
ncbi:porin family protein [Nonlabens xiamenensis]|uniref:hypothetical protein n=1 Tax=Nonlabens xiamenensis TaxID=2341043 RepID=UPI000F61519A|nr:hypothetical protein [Nonlabens xiamenensis]